MHKQLREEAPALTVEGDMNLKTKPDLKGLFFSKSILKASQGIKVTTQDKTI